MNNALVLPPDGSPRVWLNLTRTVGKVCATSDGSEKEGPHHGRMVGSGYDIEYEPPHLYPPQPSSPLDGRVNTRATIREVTWSVTLADPASRV